jgi:hypothetical protein
MFRRKVSIVWGGGGDYIKTPDHPLFFPDRSQFMRFDSSPYMNSHIPDTSLHPEEGGSKFLQLFTITM